MYRDRRVPRVRCGILPHDEAHTCTANGREACGLLPLPYGQIIARVKPLRYPHLFQGVGNFSQRGKHAMWRRGSSSTRTFLCGSHTLLV